MNRRFFLQTASGFSLSAVLNPFIIRSDEFQYDSSNPAPGSRIKRFGDGRDWFFEKRYGMFIHWGLYAIPGWHEQHQWRGRIERDEYVKLKDLWNPVHFNPEHWLDVLEGSGMKYLTVTTKHHDGFCLWDTKYTDFNTMNSPYGKDIIGMLTEACQKRNIPVCLYYSIADWNHPNYPNQGRAHELPPQPQDNPDWYAYFEFVKNQVTELCTNYGKIHGFWWDINRPAYRDPSVNEMIRRLQPDAVINNRGFDDGDFGTPEREYQADTSISFDRPTEACQSVGMESWGYRKDEDFYTDRHLKRSIDRFLVRDANYLLNVGPKADGTLPAESLAILERISTWYNSVKESLEDITPASTMTTNRRVMLTSRDRTLYVHINSELPGNVVKLTPVNTAPVKVTLLNDGRNVDFVVRMNPSDHREQRAFLNLINLPVEELSNTVMVVKLEFDRSLDDIVQPTSPFDGDSRWIFH